MITGTNLTYAYGNHRVINNISLSSALGRVLGIIGPNGSGKTTLLRLLYGALQPQEGAVCIDGKPLSQLNPREIAQQLAVVVQEPYEENAITVGEMVLLGRTPHTPPFTRTTAEDHRLAADALERVGVAHLGHRSFTSLSGGERQRVLIARALAQQGRHLLLDEPTNHLDIRYQHEILALVRSLSVTTLVVLHDLNLAAQYCDELILLDHGQVAASGTPEDVLKPELIYEVYGIHAIRHQVADHVHLSFALPPIPTLDKKGPYL
ncbi:ABC transporter ATP-binding protein [Enteractinococcus coprophilus]|uniref:Iron complex transport system ATP-binding protein n=1 Tax=Enteractinococcus coprophilus TaxID=1027633 RepID=A0A543AP34_9MICC|nr:ABC transporter ATP-binding protein [Enteractinococcus coprophilus]TQL74328.1 iron complex transport system ATP-binding protein [Enteractinococcus coprophilus]